MGKVKVLLMAGAAALVMVVNPTGPTVLANSCCSDEAFATCNPYGTCKACKNCKYCKHCSKQGGTCSVCR